MLLYLCLVVISLAFFKSLIALLTVAGDSFMSPAIFIIIVYSIAKINIGFKVKFKSDVFAFGHFYNSNPSVIPFSFVKSLFT